MNVMGSGLARRSTVLAKGHNESRNNFCFCVCSEATTAFSEEHYNNIAFACRELSRVIRLDRHDSTQAVHNKGSKKCSDDEIVAHQQKTCNFFTWPSFLLSHKKHQKLDDHQLHTSCSTNFTGNCTVLLCLDKSGTALIDALNAWIFVACVGRVLYIWANRILLFHPKNSQKIGSSFAFKNIDQELSLTKMPPFVPQGMTQWRTHVPYLLWCTRQKWRSWVRAKIDL
jgi:hypothetical protein